MIVQTMAELAQSYIAQARSSGRLSPSASRVRDSHDFAFVGPKSGPAPSCIATLLHDQRARARLTRPPDRSHRLLFPALSGSSLSCFRPPIDLYAKASQLDQSG